MAGKTRAVTTVVKLGVKYGPVAYAAIKHGKEPALELAQRQVEKLTARKKATSHAAGLTDGSVISVWKGDQQMWVVFNGDDPVASHPAVDIPLTQLVEGYDLTKRIRPMDDQRPKSRRLKAIRHKK
jgi:hypothetical protein